MTTDDTIMTSRREEREINKLLTLLVRKGLIILLFKR